MTIVAGRGARALCERLARDSMTVERKGEGITVRPGVLVDHELLEQLVRYKPELLGALRRAAVAGYAGALEPCPACDAEFVVSPVDRYCPWCDAAGWRPALSSSSAAGSAASRTLQDTSGHLIAKCPGN